jgi:tRNA uridine 5-carboxymethylaminomethyl modification enzyme
LEPEGRATNEFYINGLSTSLPFSVQVEMVRSIPGLERAELLRPAYAVEYDFAPPTQLFPSLESRKVENLFFAGQINGTTGYEEAASQGIIAGINAALSIGEKPPLVLKRDEAYIGVLIDDLITKGTEEPYRMFTSRAEYRTLLRQDNADFRLTELSYRMGLAKEERMRAMESKREQTDLMLRFFENTSYDFKEANKMLSVLDSASVKQDDKLKKLLSRPKVSLLDMKSLSPVADYFMGHQPSEEVVEQVEVTIKYSGYIDKERANADKLTRLEHVKIPDDFEYSGLRSLSFEAREKLSAVKPATVSQASRISGVSPSDISILLIHLGR